MSKDATTAFTPVLLVKIPTVGPTLTTMIGLGVGIDYALFLVTKHRDQLAHGVERRESIARAAIALLPAIMSPLGGHLFGAKLPAFLRPRPKPAATFTVIPRTRPADPRTADLVTQVRTSVVPPATAEGGITAYVGGSPPPTSTWRARSPPSCSS